MRTQLAYAKNLGDKMPELSEYLDYRQYLKAWYDEAKASNAAYSYTLFAQHLGFKSKSFLRDVIVGRRNLSQNSIYKIANGLKLSSSKKEFFRLLVAYNQAKSLEEKQNYGIELSKRNSSLSKKTLKQSQFEFYSKWYHQSVRELICQSKFDGDFNQLGKKLKPNISGIEARNSAMLLEEVGLVKKTPIGYEMLDDMVTTGDIVHSRLIEDFHKENLLLAMNSLQEFDESQRTISCLVLGLSHQVAQEVDEEINCFKKRIIELCSQDQPLEEIRHLGLQFFPTFESKAK